MKFLERLRKIDNADARRLAILIRHGERQAIPAGTFGNEVTLTQNGITESIRLGEELSRFNIGRIYTSPIDRCVQTAESIKKGLEKVHHTAEIVCDDLLGNPGFHIADANLAGKAYLKYGCIGVYEHFSRGENIEGLASIDALKGRAKQWLEEKTVEKGVTLFVTHDALIAHFALANGLYSYSAENWVDFLDGIILDFSNHGGTK